MSRVCFTCQKKAMNGNLVSHAKNRVKRKFKVNLHTHWIRVAGRRVKAKFCTKCLRAYKKLENPPVVAAV